MFFFWEFPVQIKHPFLILLFSWCWVFQFFLYSRCWSPVRCTADKDFLTFFGLLLHWRDHLLGCMKCFSFLSPTCQLLESYLGSSCLSLVAEVNFLLSPLAASRCGVPCYVEVFSPFRLGFMQVRANDGISFFYMLTPSFPSTTYSLCCLFSSVYFFLQLCPKYGGVIAWMSI